MMHRVPLRRKGKHRHDGGRGLVAVASRSRAATVRNMAERFVWRRPMRAVKISALRPVMAMK